MRAPDLMTVSLGARVSRRRLSSRDQRPLVQRAFPMTEAGSSAFASSGEKRMLGITVPAGTARSMTSEYGRDSSGLSQKREDSASLLSASRLSEESLRKPAALFG